MGSCQWAVTSGQWPVGSGKWTEGSEMWQWQLASSELTALGKWAVGDFKTYIACYWSLVKKSLVLSTLTYNFVKYRRALTGSRDGFVRLWDPRRPDTAVASIGPEEGITKQDCWSVALGKQTSAEQRVIASGYICFNDNIYSAFTIHYMMKKLQP